MAHIAYKILATQQQATLDAQDDLDDAAVALLDAGFPCAARIARAGGYVWRASALETMHRETEREGPQPLPYRAVMDYIISRAGIDCAEFGDEFTRLRRAVSGPRARYTEWYRWERNTGSSKSRAPTDAALAVCAVARALGAADIETPRETRTWSSKWPRTMASVEDEEHGLLQVDSALAFLDRHQRHGV